MPSRATFGAPARPKRVVIIDIDGLRRDVFLEALASRRELSFKALAGGNGALHRGLHLEPVSNAPAITFSNQTSLFTGAHPAEHGILGNQFFDRFGRITGGTPRHYAFDVGDTLAVDDAVRTFTGPPGLVDQSLAPGVTTLYERAAAHGVSATVVYHMVNRGAAHWLKPSLIDLARFTKGGELLGLEAAEFDGRMLNQALEHLSAGKRPGLLTLYFLGLDHHSHVHGPGAQQEYLTGTLHRLITKFMAEWARHRLYEGTLFVFASDHGQVEVVPDERHSLRLGFPFDREMAALFDALHLDVHDRPGEAPDCDAVVATNGGSAFVYLRHRQGAWAERPRFVEDVLPVARAFWEGHHTGRYIEDLRGALEMVLVRNVEREGWRAHYQALVPDGTLMPVDAFVEAHPEIQAADPVARLRHAAAPEAGDLMLIANYAGGFYFGAPTHGTHGGLHPLESQPVLSFGWPLASAAQRDWLHEMVTTTVADRCRQEGGRQPALADLVPALCAAMGWG